MVLFEEKSPYWWVLTHCDELCQAPKWQSWIHYPFNMGLSEPKCDFVYMTSALYSLQWKRHLVEFCCVIHSWNHYGLLLRPKPKHVHHHFYWSALMYFMIVPVLLLWWFLTFQLSLHVFLCVLLALLKCYLTKVKKYIWLHIVTVLWNRLWRKIWK